MSGIVYLIRDGDLHKIGITQNLDRRMKELDPDEIVATSEINNYEQLEKDLHKRYKDKRLKGSEYFRLSDEEVEDCVAELSGDFTFFRKVKKIFSSIKSIFISLFFLLVLFAIGLSIFDHRKAIATVFTTFTNAFQAYTAITVMLTLPLFFILPNKSEGERNDTILIYGFLSFLFLFFVPSPVLHFIDNLITFTLNLVPDF